MAASVTTPLKSKPFFQRHPISSYFALTFLISWTAAFLVAAPRLLRREDLPQLTGVLMFPAMLLGPCVSGIILTGLTEGKPGLRYLRSRLLRWRIPLRWYAALLVPPALILGVLLLLKTFVSAAYTPNRFFLGLFFGIPAGLLEEIGWTGYAFPRMRSRFGALSAAILLGLLWGIWHLPVIDFLGAATPHGSYWLRYFLAFAGTMTAMRVLICWLYSNTSSVLLAQLLHISSTGSLVVLSPAVKPGQEVFWYANYAATLWLVVVVLAVLSGRGLARNG